MHLILDLDGTITPHRPTSTAPFERILLPGVQSKINRLHAEGWQIGIATNQGGARLSRKGGRLPYGVVLAQIRWIRSVLPVSPVRWATTAERKKPSPVMLLEIAREWQVEPSGILFVGDAQTDKQAAENGGLKFKWADQFFNGG